MEPSDLNLASMAEGTPIPISSIFVSAIELREVSSTCGHLIKEFIYYTFYILQATVLAGRGEQKCHTQLLDLLVKSGAAAWNQRRKHEVIQAQRLLWAVISPFWT